MTGPQDRAQELDGVLARMKVGDPVCIVGRMGWSQRLYFTARGEIERLTPTQIVALGGRRFSRKTGYEIGASGLRGSVSPTLRPLTSELVSKVDAFSREDQAEKECMKVANLLQSARGQDAVRIAAMLSDELKREAAQ